MLISNYNLTRLTLMFTWLNSGFFLSLYFVLELLLTKMMLKICQVVGGCHQKKMCQIMS